jgi:membrane protein YqaA with SNARE-associated domain
MKDNNDNERAEESLLTNLPQGATIPRKRSWFKNHLTQLLALSLALLLIALIAVFRNQIIALGSYGYLGVFVLSLLGSATIVIPVPSLALVFALGGTFNPLLLGLISGIGGTLGETTGYLLGYGGRIAIENMKLYHRVEGWMKRWGAVTIFILAAIPNPFFDIAGAAAGALRFPLWKFLVYGGAGRIVKHTLVAFAGAWGMEAILRFLG